MEDLIEITVITIFILGALTLAVTQPYFEAKQFNECTNGNATYTTALFTELRIQECNKK